MRVHTAEICEGSENFMDFFFNPYRGFDPSGPFASLVVSWMFKGILDGFRGFSGTFQDRSVVIRLFFRNISRVPRKF